MTSFFRRFKEQGKYFRQIFFHIYLVSLLAVLLVGAVLFQQTVETLKNNYSIFSSQLLSNTGLLTESRIKASISMALGAHQSQSVVPFLMSGEYNAADESRAINDLRARVGLNHTVHSVYLYNRNFSHMAATHDLFIPKGNLSEAFLPLLNQGFEGNISIQLNEAWERNDLSQGRRNIVSLIYKEERWPDKPVQHAIIINMTEESFLQSTIAMPGSEIGNLFILDNNLRVLSHIDKQFLREDFSLHQIYRDMKDAPDKQITRESTLDGEKYLITRTRNDTLKMFFFHTIPVKGLMRQYRDAFWRTLLLLLPVVLLGIIGAVVGARKLYAPISNLVKQLNARSGSNEIDTIGRSLRNMTDRIHDLSSVQRNQILRKAIHIGLTENEEDQVLKNDGNMYPQFPCYLTYICADCFEASEQESYNILHLKIPKNGGYPGPSTICHSP